MRSTCDVTRRGVLAAGMLLAAPAAAAPVRLETYVPVDDARLYMLARGDDPSAPVLLWLHGGPGGAERPLFRMYNAPLERRFICAYLDQRGAGRSYDPKADPRRLTVAQHLADLDRVVDHLRRALRRERVILLGHSWGSALGLLYARDHAEKVQAFLGVGVESSAPAMRRAEYDFVAAEAHRRNDDRTLKKLERIGPPPFSARAELAIEDLVDGYGGYFRQHPNLAWDTVRMLAGGYVKPTEIARMIHGNEVSLEAMNRELNALDLTREAPRVEVPVGFLLGRYDHVTDSGLAAAYFERLAAPAKRLLWFEHSAHNAPFEEPDAFNAAVPQVLADLGVAGLSDGRRE